MSGSSLRTVQRITVFLFTVLLLITGFVGILGLDGLLGPVLREAVGESAATPLAIVAMGLATVAIVALISHLADRLQKWMGLED